jgi:putative transposase
MKDYIAADRNFKHNMFMLSDDVYCRPDADGNPVMTRSYDYDRELIDAYKKHLEDIESKKRNDPNYSYGKKVRTREKKLKEKMKQSLIRTAVEMLEDVKASGFNHFVAEQLSGSYGKNFSKDEDGINFNKLLGFIGFFSFDETLESLAHKHGIGISFVHAAYTSQTCPVCGHVHENNRKSQECFKCECCGYEANADENSSVNIKNRVTQDVLLKRLLKLSDNGEYRPKTIKR